MMQFFSIEFLSPRIFSVETTMLPRKNQLHKQPMEKGCLQRKLHFHGSMYYA